MAKTRLGLETYPIPNEVHKGEKIEEESQESSQESMPSQAPCQ